MRPEAKAQIYSVNENLPADQVARSEASLINSKELAEKENGKVADKKVNCKKK